MENVAYVVDLQLEKVLLVKDENKSTNIIVKQEIIVEEDVHDDTNDTNETVVEDVNNYDSIDCSIVKLEEELEIEEPSVKNDYGLINRSSPAEDQRFNKVKIDSPSCQESTDMSNELGFYNKGNARKRSKYNRHLDCQQTTLCSGLRNVSMKEKPLHCSHCGFGFTQPITLKKHMLAKHPFEKPLECNECHYRTLISSEMKEHILALHPNAMMHVCSECNYTTSELSDIESHTLALHFRNSGQGCETLTNDPLSSEDKLEIGNHKVLKCYCAEFSASNLYNNQNNLKIDHKEEKSFHDSSRLTDSVNKNDQSKNDQEFIDPLERTYHCPDCDFKIGSERVMIRHLKIHGNFHQCQDCGHKCLTVEELKTHLETHHLDIKPQYCQECSYTTYSGIDLEKHIANHHINAKYFCSSCKFQTDNIGDFKSHIKSDHPEEKTYLCKQCGFNTAEAGILKKHVAKHRRDQPNHSSNCDFKTLGEQSLKRHIETDPDPGRDSECFNHSNVTVDSSSNCKMKREQNTKVESEDKSLSTYYDLKKHIGNRNKNVKEHQCSHCDYKTIDSSDLKKHINNFHGSFVYHICEYCDFETTNPVHLNRHLKAIHAKEKPYQCFQCGFRASEADILKEHIITQHQKEKYFKCPDCNYKTTSVNEMNEHTTTLHSIDNLFQCDQCEYKTYIELDWNEHVASFHIKKGEKFPSEVNCFGKSLDSCTEETRHNNEKISVTLNLESSKEDGQCKLHQCPECEYQTSIRQHLARHMAAIHGKEKPYKCHLCEFGAVELIYLKRHMMSKHPPEMPYHCPDCEFKTRSERHMKNHAKTKHPNKKLSKLKKQHTVPGHQKVKKQNFHIKENQYTCSLCNKSANSSEELKKHFKKFHPSEKHKSNGNRSSIVEVKDVPKTGKNSKFLAPDTICKADRCEVSSKLRNVKIHKCNECTFRTPRPEHLSKHLEEIHKQGVKWLVCSQCEYVSTDSGSLMIHISLKHLRKHDKVKKSSSHFVNKKPKKCPLCDYQTTHSTDLKRHQLTVHKSCFDCSICSFRTNELHNLKKHVLLKHL